uniref:Uncharacterized protein n=1 Tax=Calcidiscus leptoporus TaxID=127549 RepID=A0A7S0J0M9_9EUKA
MAQAGLPLDEAGAKSRKRQLKQQERERVKACKTAWAGGDASPRVGAPQKAAELAQHKMLKQAKQALKQQKSAREQQMHQAQYLEQLARMHQSVGSGLGSGCVSQELLLKLKEHQARQDPLQVADQRRHHQLERLNELNEQAKQQKLEQLGLEQLREQLGREQRGGPSLHYSAQLPSKSQQLDGLQSRAGTGHQSTSSPFSAQGLAGGAGAHAGGYYEAAISASDRCNMSAMPRLGGFSAGCGSGLFLQSSSRIHADARFAAVGLLQSRTGGLSARGLQIATQQDKDAAEINLVVDSMIKDLERTAQRELKEERKAAAKLQHEQQKLVLKELQERERAARDEARAKEKAALKEQAVIERDVKAVLERVIKKIERAIPPEEDGELYAKMQKARKIGDKEIERGLVYRVRGAPFKLFFKSSCSLQRNDDVEAEVASMLRQLRKEEHRAKVAESFSSQQQEASRREVADAARRRQRKSKCMWVSPDEYDGNWCRLHIRTV